MPKRKLNAPTPISTKAARRTALARESFERDFRRLVDDVFRLRNPAAPGQRVLGEERLDHPSVNAARLHTIPFAHLRDEACRILDGHSTSDPPFERLTEGLLEAGNFVLAQVRALNAPSELVQRVSSNITAFNTARTTVLRELARGVLSFPVIENFIRRANNFIGNVYDIGAQQGLNLQLSRRLHMNTAAIGDREQLTPASRASTTSIVEAALLGGTRLTMPVTPNRSRVVTRHALININALTDTSRALIDRLDWSPVNVRESAVTAFEQAFRSTHPATASMPAVVQTGSSLIAAAAIQTLVDIAQQAREGLLAESPISETAPSSMAPEESVHKNLSESVSAPKAMVDNELPVPQLATPAVEAAGAPPAVLNASESIVPEAMSAAGATVDDHVALINALNDLPPAPNRPLGQNSVEVDNPAFSEGESEAAAGSIEGGSFASEARVLVEML